MSYLSVEVSISFCLQFTVTDFRRSDMNVCLILEEIQMMQGYVEGVMSIPINFFKSPLNICPKSSVDEKARDMFCADIFCGKYIGQTGCESLILSIRQAGERSGCNTSGVRQKAVPLVFYCRLKS